MKQRIALLGSTGSIGVQTLDIVRDNPEQFEITALVANRNWEQLAAQAIEFDADCVVIGDEQYYTSLKEDLAATAATTLLKLRSRTTSRRCSKHLMA